MGNLKFDSRGEYNLLVPKKKTWTPKDDSEIKQLKARTKALRDYQRASRVTPKARFIAPSIRPAQAIISKEQEMLGQLFGHGDKFFGSKKMLPISGTPDEEGSETWRSFGI